MLWNGRFPILVAMVAAIGACALLRCSGTHTAAPDRDVTLRLGLAAVMSDPTGIDSVRVTVWSEDQSITRSAIMPYSAHRAEFPKIPCGIFVTVMVEALDSNGLALFRGRKDVASVPCDEAVVVFSDADVTPRRPTNIGGRTIFDSRVAVWWRQSAPSGVTYDIERSVVASGGYTRIDTTSDTVYVDTGLAANTSLRYRIRGTNAAGVSDWLYSGVLTTESVDTSAPVLEVLSHRLADTVNAASIRLFGTVTDAHGVASVRVNDSVAFITDGFWVRDTVQLSDGLNTLRIVALDTMLQPHVDTLTMTVYRTALTIEHTPPSLALVHPADGDTVQSAVVALSGAADDQSGVDSVIVGGRPATLSGISWSIDSVALSKGRNTIAATAIDRSAAANRTQKTFVLYYRDPCDDAARAQLALLSHTAIDTVAHSVIRLVGTAYDRQGVAAVTVGGDTVGIVNGVWEAPGVVLAEGLNTITVVACDSCPQSTPDTLVARLWYLRGYVEVFNLPPVFSVTAAALRDTVKAGDLYLRNLTAHDPDAYNVLHFAADAPLVVVDDTTVQWQTSDGDTGVRQLHAYVLDQDDASDTVSWSLTVLNRNANFAPIFVSTGAALTDSVKIDSTYLDTLRATDPDGAGIVYRLTTSPAGMQIDSVTGVMVWTPTGAMRGRHTVSAVVVDQRGAIASLSYSLTVWDPQLPIVEAGANLTVSIRDTVRLVGWARSNASRIVRTEWDIGGSATFVADSPVKTFVLPSSIAQDSVLRCILRAWDALNQHAEDTARVTILRDLPRAVAGRDTVLRSGDLFQLHGSGADRYGTITSYEWDIGNTGVFAISTDGSAGGNAPQSTGPYLCILRVTDDDLGIGLDTVKVHVANSSMVSFGPGGGDPVGHIAFDMGSDSGDEYETPIHRVWLSAFWVDSTEVTVGEYVPLMGVNPSGSSDSSEPIRNVTWFDAALFCNARSKNDGMDTVYQYSSASGVRGDGCTNLNGLSIHYDRVGYRLPTEAEWELACKGTRFDAPAYFWGSDAVEAGTYAWYLYNSDQYAHRTGTRIANAAGLLDVTGNVSEWCNDWHSTTYYTECDTGTVINPHGSSGGSARINRGGSYASPASELRSTFRGVGIPSWRANFVGFRCVVSSQ